MRDRRPVDSLSINELEELLYLRRQAERAGGGPGQASRRPVRRGPLDFLLLLLEVGAVAGLLVAAFSGLNALQTLNAEAGVAQALPTFTPPRPTPLIRMAILPDGHTPPTAGEEAQPLVASLPAGVTYLVTPLPPLPPVPPPTPGPESPRRMAIPAIRVDAPVVQGIEWEQLKQGIGQVVNTALPGQVGNGVYAAHNDTYGEIFRHLDQLKPGDEIVLYTATRSFRYVVRETKIVAPTEVQVMDPTPTATLTLISCYPYLVDRWRIVVFADLATETAVR